MTRNGKLALVAAAVLSAALAAAQTPSVVAVAALRRQAAARPGPTGVWSESLSGIRGMMAWRRANGLRPGFLKAYEAFYQRRAYPKDAVDWSAYDIALVARSNMPALRIRKPVRSDSGVAMAARWTEVGPKQLDIPYQTYFGPERPLTGRVNAISWHPKDNKTVYAATAGGGAWKTVNTGGSWAALSDSDSWDYMQTGAVAVDPRSPQKVYVGTGDQRGFYRNYGRGIMVSTDGGATWARDAATEGKAVSEIAIDPTNSNVLVTTSGRDDLNRAVGKVYLKRGAGAFAAVAGLPDAVWMGCSIGAKDPADGKRFYYVAGHTLPTAAADGTIQVWRGKDGADWVNVTPAGLAAITANNLGRAGVDVSASPANLLNAYMVSGTDQKVYRTSNLGAGWEDCTNNLPSDLNAGDAYNWSQSNYDIHILCSYVPGGDKDILYCGLITFAASSDRGANWTDVGTTYTAAADTHNDQQCAAFNPRNPNQVMFGNDGGLYLVEYDPVFNLWYQVEYDVNTPNCTQFYTGAASNSDRSRLLGGTQDNASPRSYGAVSPNDGLAATIDRWNNCGGGDGGASAIDPNDPDVQWTTANGDPLRTTDGWATSTTVSLPTHTYLAVDGNRYRYDQAFVGACAIDPTGDRYFQASYHHVFRYTPALGNAVAEGTLMDRSDPPGGAADAFKRYRLGPNHREYFSSGHKMTSGGGQVTCVAVAPTAPNILYVTTSDGEVWASFNALDPVEDVRFKSIKRGLPNRSVNWIAVDPFDPERVYVAMGGTGPGSYAYACGDTTKAEGDITWDDIDNDGLPEVSANGIAIENSTGRAGGRIWVASDCGVFVLEKGTWQNATTPLGLPNVQVNSLVLDQGTDRITAFTFGRGAWQLPLNGVNAIAAFGLDRTRIPGGTAGVKGRVVLTKPAPAGGQAVSLSTDVPATFTVPASVTVPEGKVVGEFTVDVAAVASVTGAFILAEVGAEQRFFFMNATP